MKYAKSLTAAGIALILGIGAPVAWGQSMRTSPSGSTMPPAASSKAPAESVGGNTTTMSPGYSTKAMLPANEHTARFVHKKIKEAKKEGKSVAHAKAQERLARIDLRKGEKHAAAEHFQIALESIGVNASEATKEMSPNSSGATTPNSSTELSGSSSSMRSGSSGSSSR